MSIARAKTSILVSSGLLLLASTLGAVADDKMPAVKMSDNDKKFEKMMTNATLTGQFSIVGKMDKPPKPEKYIIESAKKIKPNVWTITARIKYGKWDIRVPMNITVEWAGNTPVMVIDQLTIPAMGTFDARVLFHSGRYVGTWQHGKVGGHLWGTLSYEKPADKVEEPKTEPAPKK